MSEIRMLAGQRIAVLRPEPTDRLPLIDGLAACVDGRADFTIELQRQPLAPPTVGARPPERLTLDCGHPAEAHIDGETRWLILPDRAGLHVDRVACRAVLACPDPATSGDVLADLVALALEAAVDHAGATVLHAATLKLTGQEGWTLLLAESGVGKTTTALAMARAGATLGADDAAVLAAGPRGYVATPLPRPLNVHDATFAMLPWLAEVSTGRRRGAEREVALADLGDAVLVDVCSTRPVTALVRLTRGAPGMEARLTSCRAEEMLVSLVADHVRYRSDGLSPDQVRRLDLLVGVAGSVPCYTLEVGSDLSSVSKLLADGPGVGSSEA